MRNITALILLLPAANCATSAFHGSPVTLSEEAKFIIQSECEFVEGEAGTDLDYRECRRHGVERYYSMARDKERNQRDLTLTALSASGEILSGTGSLGLDVSFEDDDPFDEEDIDLVAQEDADEDEFFDEDTESDLDGEPNVTDVEEHSSDRASSEAERKVGEVPYLLARPQ